MKKRPAAERLVELKAKLVKKVAFVARVEKKVAALRLKIDKMEHDAKYVPPVSV